MRGLRVVERAVATADDVEGDIGVRSDNGYIEVVWTCGATRSFSPEDLAETVGHIESMAAHPDVWFAGKDSRGQRLVVRLVDGELYGAAECPTQTADHVPWKALKKALKKAR